MSTSTNECHEYVGARPASSAAITIDSETLAEAEAQLSLTMTHEASAVAAEVLLLAASAGEEGQGPRLLLEDLPEGIVDAAALESALACVGFSAGLGKLVRLPAAGLTPLQVKSIAVIGLGKALAYASDAGRDSAALGEDREGALWQAAGAGVRCLAGVESALVALPARTLSDFEAVTQGLAAGAYAWSARSPQAEAPLAAATVIVPEPRNDGDECSCAQRKQILTEARALAGAIRLTRDLVNEPPNRLTPCSFAQVAVATAAKGGLEVEVLDEVALAEQGFGGILGVGQGSVHPPRLVRVTWAPEQAERHVSLIGKGITFDSGGLSLKPAPSMPEMKSDMAGAATVLGTVLAAARLELPVRVDAWLALAENLPSMDAQRPSDIVTMYGGKTVEILNTDAEGRLVMADALARAVEDEPDAVLDVATLTGAQLVALGSRVSGVMGTPVLRDLVAQCGAASSEAFWAMPLPEHLRSSLDSEYAALSNANMGSRWGGMLTAGLFLREFVADVPWAHLDVAGPAFNDGAAWGPVPVGGTGFGVRTLITLIKAIGAGADLA